MSTRPDSIIRPPGSSDIDRYAPFKYRYDSATKSVAFSQRENKKWIELPIDRTYARYWYKVGIAVRSAEFIKKTSGLFSVISHIPYIGQKFDLREKVAHWGVYFEDPETQKYSIVGLNFDDKTRQELILEGIWPTASGYVNGMNVQAGDFEKSHEEQFRDVAVYCCYEEFVLHAHLAIKHYMNTLPKDIAGFEVYHNPEVSPIRGDNYLFLAKNCQHFAKFFMGRMIGGKWTSEERIYDQNKGDWVENTINGGKKWVANKERDPSRFYLTEMARYIIPHVSISDTLAGMSKLGLQQKPVIDFGQVPGKLWADGLELLSRFAMYVFTSLEKIVARSAGTRRPETEVGNGRAHQD